MILNGKAKEKFLEWISLNNLFTIEDREKYFNSLSELFQNALIIEFFDSVGIYICVTPVFPIYIYGWSYSIDLDNCYDIFKTRQQATKQAIIKTNQIYNERFK